MKTIKKTILSFTLVFFMMILPVGDSAGMVTAQAQTMVYVTPTGSKYHFPKLTIRVLSKNNLLHTIRKKVFFMLAPHFIQL